MNLTDRWQTLSKLHDVYIVCRIYSIAKEISTFKCFSIVLYDMAGPVGLSFVSFARTLRQMHMLAQLSIASTPVKTKGAGDQDTFSFFFKREIALFLGNFFSVVFFVGIFLFLYW